jgi:transposase
MYLTILNRQNEAVLRRNMKTDGKTFLQRLEPYRSSIVVACESTASWYWFADLCQDAGIEFVLGHALYMKAIHGSKKKNDRVDSEKIARLTAGGLLPQAYVYPRALRYLRDLLRRRLKLTRQRAELYTHMHALNFQFNLPPMSSELKSKAKRCQLPDRFEDPAARRSVEADLELIEYYTPLIRSLEIHVKHAADQVYAKERIILESIPGIGMITSLTILLEIDHVDRFPTRQKFCSYSRLVYPRGESDGKLYGCQGRKHGNPYLKWAFTEAAVHAASHCEPIKKLSLRLERKYGKGKGKSVLAHKMGRSVYYMLLRKKLFDLDKFLRT